MFGPHDQTYRLYLVYGVHGGQLPQGGHTEHLHHQVGPQQVGQQLEHLELRVTHPHLSHQPGQGGVTGQEDGGVPVRILLQLRTSKGDYNRQSKVKVQRLYCYTRSSYWSSCQHCEPQSYMIQMYSRVPST